MRRFAVFLLVMMLLVGTAVAQASSIPLEEVTYADYGFSIGVPEDWRAVDMAAQMRDDPLMTEEERAQAPDMLIYFLDETMQMSVQVMCWQSWVPDAQALEEMTEAFGDSGAWMVTNGQQVFRFEASGEDVSGAYIVGEGVLIGIVGAPVDDTVPPLVDAMLETIEFATK